MGDSELFYDIIEDYVDEDSFTLLKYWELSHLVVVQTLIRRAIEEKADEEIQEQIEP